MNHITTHTDSPQDNGKSSDASVIKMLDELFVQEDLGVILTVDGWHLVHFVPDNTNLWTTLDTFDTRAAAYRAGIDCLIDAVLYDISQGGDE